MLGEVTNGVKLRETEGNRSRRAFGKRQESYTRRHTLLRGTYACARGTQHARTCLMISALSRWRATVSEGAHKAVTRRKSMATGSPPYSVHLQRTRHMNAPVDRVAAVLEDTPSAA